MLIAAPQRQHRLTQIKDLDLPCIVVDPQTCVRLRAWIRGTREMKNVGQAQLRRVRSLLLDLKEQIDTTGTTRSESPRSISKPRSQTQQPAVVLLAQTHQRAHIRTPREQASRGPEVRGILHIWIQGTRCDVAGSAADLTTSLTAASSASLFKFRDRGLLVVVVVIEYSPCRDRDHDNDNDLRRSWDFRTVALVNIRSRNRATRLDWRLVRQSGVSRRPCRVLRPLREDRGTIPPARRQPGRR